MKTSTKLPSPMPATHASTLSMTTSHLLAPSVPLKSRTPVVAAGERRTATEEAGEVTAPTLAGSVSQRIGVVRTRAVAVGAGIRTQAGSEEGVGGEVRGDEEGAAIGAWTIMWVRATEVGVCNININGMVTIWVQHCQGRVDDDVLNPMARAWS